MKYVELLVFVGSHIEQICFQIVVLIPYIMNNVLPAIFIIFFISHNLYAVETGEIKNISYIINKNIFGEKNDQKRKECINADDIIKQHVIVVGDSCLVKKDAAEDVTKIISSLFVAKRKASTELNLSINPKEDFDVIVIYVPIREHADKNKDSTVKYKYIPVIMTDFKKDLFFDFNSSKLKDSGYMILHHFVYNVILSLSNYNIITVIGHADNVGDEKSNFELSKKRSDAAVSEIQRQIKNYDFSVDSFTIESVGAGETQPLERFTQETKSQVNRRIDILFSSSSYAMYTARKYIQCIYKSDLEYINCFDKYLSK
jgi:outer membrane protein OmpA-like peptidoglycan-associated protein